MARRKNVKAKIRPITHALFFTLVVSATFYPLASALFFGKSVNDTIDPRGVLGTKIEKHVSAQSGVFRNGVVTIAFDDGWISTYTNGLPVLDEFKFPGTFYIMSNFFSDTQYMSLAQAQSLIDRGHQVGSHTVSHAHLPDLDSSDLTYELEASKKQLEAKLGPITDFASPYGEYDEDVLEAIKPLYRSHRNVISDINTFENFNIYELKSPNVTVATTNEEIMHWLNKAKETSGWLILTYHEINDSGREYSLSAERFREQMQLVQESGMPVQTLDSVLNEIEAVYGAP